MPSLSSAASTKRKTEPSGGEDDVTWTLPGMRKDGGAQGGNFEDILGIDFNATGADRSGLGALVNSALVAHQRLPVLEAIFDRTARRMSTSLRQMTDEAADVTLDDVSSTRLGDFLESQETGVVIGVIRSQKLESYCLMAADGLLVHAVVDLLLGARRSGASIEAEGRAFTAIELGLAQRVLQALVADFNEAFRPIEEAGFAIERIETTSRFAAIAQDASVCALAKFRIRMGGVSTRLSLLIPHSSIEPVRDILLRDFVNEAGATANNWRTHLAAEVRSTEIEVTAVLAEPVLTIRALQQLEIGSTLALGRSGGADIGLHAGGARIARGRFGRAGDWLAVRLQTAPDGGEALAAASVAEAINDR